MEINICSHEYKGPGWFRAGEGHFRFDGGKIQGDCIFLDPAKFGEIQEALYLARYQGVTAPSLEGVRHGHYGNLEVKVARLAAFCAANLPSLGVKVTREGEWEGDGHGILRLTFTNGEGEKYGIAWVARCKGPGYSCSYSHGPWCGAHEAAT